MPDHPVPEPKSSTLQGGSSGHESDLGELAALFAERGGGGLSAEVSAGLALEVVLNEIVEQACLATNATGAAIVLVRDGEMVCRASSGANAPQLGAPLGSDSGLTAECIKTRQVQRCDDAQADPRADAEASRRLGVRSVMVIPLLRKGEMAGVLEVFSPELGAFGDQDELTLKALAYRILMNLNRASEPSSLSSTTVSSGPVASVAAQSSPARPVSVRAFEVEESRAGSPTGVSKVVPMEIAGRRARAGFDVVSLTLGAVVLICAVLLGTLVGVRLGWRRAAAVHGHMRSASDAGLAPRNAKQGPAQNLATENAMARNGPTQADGEAGMNASSASAPSGAGNAGAAADEKKNEKKEATVPASKPAARAKDSFPPAGTLLVYENGKEIFRLPPTKDGEATEVTQTTESGAPGEVQRASALEPAGMVELAPEVAEGSLLHRVEPEYPEAARQQRMQGAVVLEVRIGRDGDIQDVKLVSGEPLLANAAIAAVKQWRFKPRVVKGQPVEMQTRITFNFRMPA